jgi:enoyl-CoA hydratase/carnithine racemase
MSTMGMRVTYVTDKGVSLITLTDPPVNALTHEMLKELDASLLDARFDDDVHVLVVTGHGDAYFSAGVNAQMLKEAGASFENSFNLHAHEVFLRIENTPKLVIAAINGHCLDAGMDIALACDLRIAREGPARLAVPPTALGGIERLVRTLGRARAIQIVTEASPMSPDEAFTAGLVHKVWQGNTNEDFVQKVVEYAHGLCPPHRGALAVAALKRPPRG